MPSASALRAGKAVIELMLGMKAIQKQVHSAANTIRSTLVKAFKGIRIPMPSLKAFSAIGQQALSLRNILVGGAATAALAFPVKLAANLEVAAAQMSTFMSSEQAARDLLLDLQAFSGIAMVPLENLAQNAALLLKFGVAEEQVAVHTKALTVIAAGSSEEFEKLGLAFAQVASAGRLQGEEMRQFKNTAFNPLREIAERTGETMDEVKLRMEAGGISFQEVANVLQAATGPMGRFAGLLERISNTFRGQLSRALAQFKTAILPIGEVMLKPLTEFLKQINKIIPRIGEFIRNNAEWFASAMKVGVAIAGLATAFVTFGLAAAIVSVTLGGIWSLLTAVVAILAFAIPVIGAAFIAMRGLGMSFSDLKKSAAGAFSGIVGTLREMLELSTGAFRGVMNALVAGDLKLAASIAWAGIVAVFRVGTEKLRELWIRFKYEFMRVMLGIKIEFQKQWLTMMAWLERMMIKVGTKLEGILNKIPLLAGTDLGLRSEDAVNKELVQSLGFLDLEKNLKSGGLDILKNTFLGQIANQSAEAREALRTLNKEAARLAANVKDQLIEAGLGKQFADAGAALTKKADDITGASAEAFLDTRLARQALGGNVEQDQLDELRKIRRIAENRGPGEIPVV